MKDLDLNNGTTLILPDENGSVKIKVQLIPGPIFTSVSFKDLQTWVASIQEQIITSSKGQAKGYSFLDFSNYDQGPKNM